MAGTRKYEGLPDLDIAPDVYETPELTDDVSTLQATSARSTSQNSDAEDGPEDESGIDRRHWRTGQARSRFRPARVNAENVDFSERLNATRQSYRTFTGRRRPGLDEDDLEEIGDFSDEEDESLDRKLARLRREVEQVKTALEDRKSEAKEAPGKTETATTDDGGDPLATIGKISEALDAVYAERHGDAKGAEAGFSRTLEKFAKAEELKRPAKSSTQQPTYSTPASEQQLGQALSKAADFDTRLTFLENALGLNGSNMPDTSSEAPKLILPTLGSLERLIELATASPDSLEAVHGKTRQLVKDAERLHRLRLEDGDGPSPGDTTSNRQPVPQSADSQEQVSKVNALYGVLPTIDSLSPTVPLVLDRLRTLRLIHTSAAGASEMLDDIEKHQAEQAEEISQWRNALEQVEENLSDGQSALVGNVQKMGEMIKALEARVSKVT